MITFSRGVRLGAGLAGLGWGLVRMARGHRNWASTMAISAGASLVLRELSEEAGSPLRYQMHGYGRRFVHGRYSRIGRLLYNIAPPWMRMAADITEDAIGR